MPAKVEFGSPAWIDLARQFLEETIPPLGEALDGIEFTICEVFTNAPRHIAGDDGRVAWHVVIDGPTVKVGDGKIENADYFSKSDYQSVLPIARTVYSDNPGSYEVIQAERAAAIERGERAATAEIPLALAGPIRELHDHLARNTV